MSLPGQGAGPSFALIRRIVRGTPIGGARVGLENKGSQERTLIRFLRLISQWSVWEGEGAGPHHGRRGPIWERERAARNKRSKRIKRLGRPASCSTGTAIRPRLARCGRGRVLPPAGGRWRCTSCEPPALPADASGWSFWPCRPARRPRAREPLPYPPGWRGWPDEQPPLPVLPDPASAPLGKCTGCGFIAPLTPEGRCGRCETSATRERRGDQCRRPDRRPVERHAADVAPLRVLPAGFHMQAGGSPAFPSYRGL